MIPEISFSYLHLNHLTKEQVKIYIEQIVEYPIEKLQTIYNEYALFAHENNNLHHNCPIHEILKDELFDTYDFYKDYTELIDIYTKEKIDMVITSDENHIKEKIKAIIDFGLNKIYNDHNKIKIIINDSNDIHNLISIPNIIYSSILSCDKIKIIGHDEATPDNFNVTIYKSINLIA